jgi:hypothetical protein
MYRAPDDEAARRDAALDAEEAAAFGRRAARSKRKLVLTIGLVLLGLMVAGACAIHYVLSELAELASALPHGDPSCIQSLPDGGVLFDPACVNGTRIPQVPPRSSENR